MPDSIYIGNFAKGLNLSRLPFNIDNDAFPNMYNFYSWRGRAKKKRGTLFLGRCTRQIERVLNATPPAVYQFGQLDLIGGTGNLVTSTVIAPGITNATQAVVTVNGHIFRIGDTVILSGVVGMTQINGSPYSVVATTTTTITLAVNSTGFGVWVSGGIVSFFDGSPTIKPGTIDIFIGADEYTEPSPPDGTLLKNGVADPGSTINYATGQITIAGGGTNAVVGDYAYYPMLPAMGARDFSSTISTSIYPSTLFFDQFYSYQCNQAPSNANFFVTSYYKNTNIPFTWSGTDYQLFYSTNYSGALWATNSKPGFHFVNGTYVSGSGTTTITFTFTKGGNAFTTLIVGDVLFFNEWDTGGSNINNTTGIVSDASGSATGTYVVTFADARTVAGTGIAQLLTNSIPGQDGIKWYDGDPTSGTGIPTGNGFGWVNFAPPLTALTVSIRNTPAAKYYLIGALLIVPFKDRILFMSPTIGTSSGVTITLTNTVIWSWNGTPYYTVGSTGLPVLVPINETANPTAYYVDQTGLGGWIAASIPNPIKTVGDNEDALMVGFGGDGIKTRFVYTGNDLNPFVFFSINSELPSSSTFSSVSLDVGVIDIGAYGIAITDQQSSRRVDLDIPNSIFQVQNLNNGIDRVNGLRDYFREWIYFSYPINTSDYRFPTQTLMYNYRESTWGYFYENFTCQGYYRASIKRTWQTLPFKSWSAWREPWNSGSSSALFPDVIAGTPQGFFLIKSQGTQESDCCGITNIVDSGGFTQITSINHCVTRDNPNIDAGDYLLFNNVIGLKSSTITAITLGTSTVITCVNTFTVGKNVTIAGIVGTTELNGNTYSIIAASGTSITLDVDSSSFTPYISGGTVTSAFNGLIGLVIMVIDDNNFVVDLLSPEFNTVYLGLGTFAKLCLPLLQTKQFPFYWEIGRKTRLCSQRYLMDFTADSQATIQIYLSQDPDLAYTDPVNVPPPNALIYSQVLFTCPESTNIGLTPANTNLQMPTAEGQYQIWHRMNNSLIGDSVQIGLTLSDAQMRSPTYSQAELTLHGMVLTVEKGPMLA